MFYQKFSVMMLFILLFGFTLGCVPLTSLLPSPHGLSEVVQSRIASGQDYTPSTPLLITNDVDLNSSFPGRGTLADPIRIEGYNITASSGSLIYIRDTTFYFRISNCFLNGMSSSIHGIYLENVIHGTIENNTIFNNRYNGIKTENSHYNIITGNTIYDNLLENGIWLLYSNHNHISNNTVFNHPSDGIRLLLTSSNNSVINNTCFNNGWVGIRLQESVHNTTIAHNTVFDSGENGILVEGPVPSNDNIVSHNLVHDNQFNGILLVSASNCAVTHNVAYNHDHSGLKVLDNSTNNLLAFNTVSNSGWSGIFIFTLPLNSTDLLNNICFNNSYNTSPDLSAYSTSGISIVYSRVNLSNNVVFDNFDNGMLLFVENIPVLNNTVRTNGRHGISVALSNTTSFSVNEVFANAKDGFHFSGSFNNSIFKNIVYDNLGMGISFVDYVDDGISGSNENNSIFMNGFSGNNVVGSQASDDGQYNVFSDNYWGDWIRSGPYALAGSSGNQDLSPSANPFHILAPIITAPTSVTSTLTGTVNIHWTPSTDLFGHPLTYSVFLSLDDGVEWIELVSGLTTTNYSWDVTALDDGTQVLLKVFASDGFGFLCSSPSSQSFSIDHPPPTTALTSTSAIAAPTPSGNTLLVLFALFAMISFRLRKK
ncbi:MAG: right-handed parallel beta-helix repeat-containing protein [Candidatus Hodarchaeota archaeon]